MKNDKYWANRMRILEESLLDTGYEYTQNLEKQYRMAVSETEKQIAAWYQRFAKNNEISFAEAKRLLSSRELDEFRWTVEEYIEKGKDNAVSQQWIKQLENASARVHVSRLDSLKLHLQQQAELLHGNQLDSVDGIMRNIYSEGYYRTAFEVQRGLGVGWSFQGLNESAIQKVLSGPWTTDGQTFSDRIWENKQSLVNSVNTNLTQMIMRGESPDKAIKAIAHQLEVSKSKAGRLVMTESAAFSSAAQKDCFNALDVERYEIIGTLDGETCELCGSLDGKIYDMSDYAVGSTAPPFHPWCRCCTAPYFEDMEGERAARDKAGKYYTVPADMTFEEWKKKSQNVFTNTESSDIIKLENVAMHRKSTKNKIEPMPAKQFHRIEKRFKKLGGVFQYGDQTEEYLKSKNAEAITYNENTVLFKKKPGRASVFEELIHTHQYKTGKNDGSYLARLNCEIEAQKKLLIHQKAYKLTDAEIKQTQKALDAYESELAAYIKKGGN